MNTDIKTLDDLKQFAKDHMDYCHEVRMGRIKDDDGTVIVYDVYWKGVNSAYINMYNAINKLKANLENKNETNL